MRLSIAKLAAAAALTVVCATAASADGMLKDKVAHGSLKDGPMPAEAPSWAGCYGGLSLGGAFGNFKNSTSTYDKLGVGLFGSGGLPPGSDSGYYFGKPGDKEAVNGAGGQSSHGGSLIGGGQIGCNVQTGLIVLGLEGDLNAMNLRGKSSSTAPYGASQPGQTFTINSEASANGLFTLRGRLGFVSNNWLFFGTAGLAVTNHKANFTFTDTNVTALETASFSRTVAGYALGGGAEVMLGNGWSLKGEYLHLGFGKTSVSSNNFRGINPGPGVLVNKPETFIDHNSKLDADIVRIGINRKF
jgi:outer membrane immunogenic protein